MEKGWGAPFEATECQWDLRIGETIKDLQYAWDMQIHVNCFPLNVNAKRNHKSGCNGIQKKVEQR